MSKEDVLFVLCGNCRTFIDCIDSCYNNIITQLFNKDKYNIYVYLYLKLTDPGPKGQDGWNFTYTDVDYNLLVNKISDLQSKFENIKVEYKILLSNENSDEELMSQVLDRSKYVSFYTKDSTLVRGLHCHYNLERCGHFIVGKEEDIRSTFKYIVYVRPDLFFTGKCEPIDTYDNTLVTLGSGPNCNNNDHIAIIPRDYFNAFFFDRMNIYRTNATIYFRMPEDVYWHTIKYIVRPIGSYFIKR